MPASQTPAYNLKVVLKETGIAADTLRAWERRYGLPRPQRTPGGHRLYSQRDIQLIKWLMARQQEGLSISRAVDLWQEQTASGQDPLASSAPEIISAPAGSASAPANLAALRGQWLAACMAYNESAADQVINQALALYPVESVMLELLLAGLHEIGESWYQGELSVQQEHFASALALRRVNAIISAAPAPTRPGTILLACPAGEMHSFPLLLLSLLLRRRGWNTVYLGANVPSAQLEQTVRAVQPALVVMAAQGLVTAASLHETAVFLAGHSVPVAYGGGVFVRLPQLRDQMPGYYLDGDLQQAPQEIEDLLSQPMRAAPSPLASAPSVARSYRLKRPLIEAALRGYFAEHGPEGVDMAPAFLHFGPALQAALQLGHVGYLEADLDWLRDGLAGSGSSAAEHLPAYLSAYSDAIRTVMGAEGAPIAGWLAGYASRL
jgi:DNA-binding transcriptional MerR regulator